MAARLGDGVARLNQAATDGAQAGLRFGVRRGCACISRIWAPRSSRAYPACAPRSSSPPARGAPHGRAPLAQVHLSRRDLALATIEGADVSRRAEVAVSGVAAVVEAAVRPRPSRPPTPRRSCRAPLWRFRPCPRRWSRSRGGIRGVHVDEREVDLAALGERPDRRGRGHPNAPCRGPPRARRTHPPRWCRRRRSAAGCTAGSGTWIAFQAASAASLMGTSRRRRQGSRVAAGLAVFVSQLDEREGQRGDQPLAVGGRHDSTSPRRERRPRPAGAADGRRRGSRSRSHRPDRSRAHGRSASLRRAPAPSGQSGGRLRSNREVARHAAPRRSESRRLSSATATVTGPRAWRRRGRSPADCRVDKGHQRQRRPRRSRRQRRWPDPRRAQRRRLRRQPQQPRLAASRHTSSHTPAGRSASNARRSSRLRSSAAQSRAIESKRRRTLSRGVGIARTTASWLPRGYQSPRGGEFFVVGHRVLPGGAPW